MADVDSLTTLDSPVVIGAPTRYRLVQDQDIFEIRAYFGEPPEAAYLAVARFLSNQETHLFGECVMWSPAIRHVGVLSLNNVTASEDIVSFRTGPAPGDEVLRVTADGLLTVPLRTAYASLHATAFMRTIKGADNSAAGLVVAGASFETAYLGVANSTTAGFHAALPERVPDGATITSIGILYWRAAGGDTVTLRLFKTTVTDNTGTSVHTATGTGTAAAVTYLEDSVSPGEVIDYSTYAYGLVVTLGNGTAGNARFYALRITYTITTVGS